MTPGLPLARPGAARGGDLRLHGGPARPARTARQPAPPRRPDPAFAAAVPPGAGLGPQPDPKFTG